MGSKKMIKKLLIIALFLLILPFVSAVSDISVDPTSYTITADVSEQITRTIELFNSNTNNSWLVTLPGTIDFIGSGHNLDNVPVVYTGSVTSVNIENNSSEIIDFTFSVPSDAYAETYAGVLNFTTSSNEHYAELDLTLDVNEDHDITVNDLTLNIAQGQTGTGTLTLTNNGNIDETATLPAAPPVNSTTNTSNTLSASISPVSLNVPYKKTNSTTVTINVPSNAAKETYTANIGITYNGQTVNSLLTLNVIEPVYSINTGSIVFPLTDPNSTVSKTFTIKNTGNADLTNVSFSSNIAGKYNLIFDATAFDLGIGESKNIKADVFVPYDEPVGNHSIGTVNVLTNQQSFISAYNVYINVEAKLDIYDLDVFVDGDQQGGVVNGDKVDEDAKPGSDIELRFKLQNTFSEDSNIDINDITVTATLIDPDDDEIDEADVDVGDLGANEKSDEDSIKFDIPLDVQEGKYTIEIVVEGEDDNGVPHDLEWRIFFDLNKKSHEIIIDKLYLTPERVICTRTSNLNVRLMNTGAKTENEARLTITNSDLEINIDEKDIELSKDPDDDENTYSYSLFIDAKDIAAGSYPIVVKAYYNEDLLDDVKTVTLFVEDCVKAKKNETAVVIQPPVTESPKTEEPEVILPTIGEGIPTTIEKPLIQSAVGLALLVLGNIVVLVLIVFLVVKLFVLPKKP